MSPYPGGPVYQTLRSSILFFRRGVVRKLVRYIDRNYNMERAAWYGQPELSIDYHKNYWYYFTDQAYQNGVLSKSFIDCYKILPYALFGAIIGAMHYRFLKNDKYNVFKKWRTVEEEE